MRTPIRWIPTVVALLASGCGGSPSGPTDVPSARYSVSGQLVNALDRTLVVVGTIRADGLPTATTDAHGSFTLSTPTPGEYRITVTADGYVERQTGVQVPGPKAAISLVPASFDLVTYDEFARPPSSGMVRWVEPPRLAVYTHVLDCPAVGRVVVLPDSLAEGDISGAIFFMRRALEGLSGGALRDFAEVVRESPSVGETVILDHIRWQGTVHAGACRSLAGDQGDQDGGGNVIRYRRYQEAFVPSIGYALWKNTIAGTRRAQVVMHEFGHALGLGHTFTMVPSIMSYNAAGYASDITPFDRLAGQIMFQRPPGNSAPDTDPRWFVVNQPVSAAALSGRR